MADYQSQQQQSLVGSQMMLNVALKDCQVLLKGLQALSFGERISFNVQSSGIVLKNQQHRTCNLSFFLEWDLFECTPTIEENFAFAVDSKGLILFLQIFGSESHNDFNMEIDDDVANSCQLEMHYEGHGSNLELKIEKNYHETVCSMATYETTLDPDFEMPGNNVVNEAIIDSMLKELWSEFDTLSSTLRIGFSKEEDKLSFSSESSYGKNTFSLTRDTEFILSCKIQETKEHNYQMKMVQKCYKALSQANKINLRVDNNGMLSMVMMIDLDHERQAFAIFTCCALTDDA
ncbi:cell cycle checkpoint protein RAD1-like [Brevipalpus obovatus]|uniref:cell cycle checkpoint protein RAD1-like n=1 Tax=Brevipalpus obovatus TaxID=246614 RepID=UPI003D9EA024